LKPAWELSIELFGESPSIDSYEQQSADTIIQLRKIDLGQYRVIGGIVRFDESARNSLKDTKQKMVTSLISHSRGRDNYLVWAPPGSGKSFFIQEIAKSLEREVEYRELNLAQLDERGFRNALAEVEKSEKPRLVLIDEVDSKPAESWPYEALLPSLEPLSDMSSVRTCFVLAGSSGNSLSEMKQVMKKRPKGVDLLSRIPSGNECVIPKLELGDKFLVLSTQFLRAAKISGKNINEVEKLVFYYVALNPQLSGARQIRQLAVRCMERVPMGEDRIKYDYLFDAGDPENKEFWIRASPRKSDLVNAFVRIEEDEPFHPRAAIEVTKSASIGKEGSRQEMVFERNRLAVLPFTNMSPNAGDEYFSDGLTEELISTISTISGLHVISRTSAMQYKNPSKKIADIGRELGVGSLVEGSVRKSSDQIRIAVQLIDTQTDEHLWSESYNRRFEDIFAIQSDIAQRVADSLRVQLLKAEKKQIQRIATTDTEAHNAYFKGRFFWRQRTDDGLTRAREYFQFAIGRDPNYALAYSGLADCYTASIVYGHLPFNDTLLKLRDAAMKAVWIDENLAEAHTSFAISLALNNDFGESEKEFKRALELNPSYSTSHQWYAQMLATVDRFEEADDEIEKARGVDPLSPTTFSTMGFVHILAELPDQAIEELENYRQIDPDYLPVNLWLGFAYAKKFMFKESIPLIKSTLPHLPIAKTALGYTYARAKMHVECAEILADLEKSASESFDMAAVASIYAELGNQEECAIWFEKACAKGDFQTGFLFRFLPWFKPLRETKLFQEYVKKIVLDS
jgi:TolB-like protein